MIQYLVDEINEYLNKKIDSKLMESRLNEVLTDEEKIELFENENLLIDPIIYMFEVADETGEFCLESSYNHKMESLQNGLKLNEYYIERDVFKNKWENLSDGI